MSLRQITEKLLEWSRSRSFSKCNESDFFIRLRNPELLSVRQGVRDEDFFPNVPECPKSVTTANIKSMKGATFMLLNLLIFIRLQL